jgi:hypothetical protein
MLFIKPSTATIHNAYLMSIIAHEDGRPVLDLKSENQPNQHEHQPNRHEPARLGIVLGKAVSFFSIFIQKSSTFLVMFRYMWYRPIGRWWWFLGLALIPRSLAC